ncbi:MAG TPA: PAS domain S-box protein [Bryobacteraceae bacterium]|jgi:PAS domain S-box-containing protein|nr:PAS domain S-box protein [Bryobacteraceae bacterium]
MAAKPITRWHQAFESLADAPIPTHELDLDGRIVRVNTAGCRLLGLPEDEIIGRHVWDFVAPGAQAASRDRIFHLLQTGEPMAALERNYLRPDGGALVVEIHSNYLRDADGNIRGVRSFLIDITLRKRAEEALRRAQESLEYRIKERTAELELANAFLRREMEDRRQAEEEHKKLEAQVQHAQRLESLGVLAGGIAHDFNNLLASIMGYASLAAMDLNAESRARKSIDQVLVAAKSAADLTQQMLAYSGRGTFVLEAVNITHLIESVVRLLESTISKKATLRLELASGLPAILADASQIRQVVMNLITNAAESLGDRTGTVQVTTGRERAELGQLPAISPGHVLPAGDYVCIEVRDTGCGMDDETLSKIFDPFFTTKFTGRGLGLAAVLGIIRGHHGSIQVESRPGTGTVFRVIFPAIDTGLEEEVASLSESDPWQAEGLVLVVDDQPGVRELAQTILERVGLTVLTAGDGKQAVDVFDEHSNEIHAVLLDLNMPGMDGAEVFWHMTQMVPGIRVVLCSGYNEQDVTTKLHGLQPAGFLRKPYHPADLLNRMRVIW